MKLRVVFACGLAELMTCSWIAASGEVGAAAQTILIVYGENISMPAAHRQETLGAARYFGNFDEVVDLTDAAGAGEWSRLRRPAPVSTALRETLARADQILTHTLWRYPEQMLLDLCPKAEIVLFDNGLDSHTPRKRTNAKGFDPSIRDKDFARVAAAVYTLGDMLAPPDHALKLRTIIPSGEQLRTNIRSLATDDVIGALCAATRFPTDRCAVLIGTSLYRGGHISAEEEAAVYKTAIDRAIGQGFGVVFKEHPRTSAPIIETPDAGVVSISSSMPVEFYPLLMDVCCSASISSSALLTLNKVFGIPAELIGEKHWKALGLPWMEALRTSIAVGASPAS